MVGESDWYQIRTEYGSVVALVEHPHLDENRTLHAGRLVRALRNHLYSIDDELTNYVNQKYG